MSCIGLIQLDDHRKCLFSKERICEIERLASYLSIALDKLRTEDALRYNQDHLRTIMEQAPEGYGVYGPEMIQSNVHGMMEKLIQRETTNQGSLDLMFIRVNRMAQRSDPKHFHQIERGKPTV